MKELTRTVTKKDAIKLAKISNSEYNDFMRTIKGKRAKPFIDVSYGKKLGSGHHALFTLNKITDLLILKKLKDAGVCLSKLRKLNKYDAGERICYTNKDNTISIYVRKDNIMSEIIESLS